MKNLIIVIVILAIAGLGYLLFSGESNKGVTVTSEEVTVIKGDIEALLYIDDSFEETLVIFGGLFTSHKNSVNQAVISGLTASDALEIHKEYPDFFKCASPGASEAKSLIQQYSLIASSDAVLTTLRKAIDDFNDNIRSGGDRVCIKLEGSILELEHVKVPKANADMTGKLDQFDYYLVNSAEIISWPEIVN